MVSRSFPNSSNRTKLGGPSLVDTLSERFTTLFNAIALVPTVITNVDNDYTITIDPALEEDVVNNMAFYITPNAAPTGAARIRIGSSNPYYKWAKIDGSDFEDGDITTDKTYLTVFVNGEFRLVTELAASVSDIFDIQRFDSSGTWTKPTSTGFGGNSRVRVRAWGAGGGGMGGSTEAAGGGGGGYVERWMLLSELGATETVTIGAGGSGGGDGGDGGNSTFGSHVTGYGGGGAVSKSGDGGGGGGPLGPGDNATPGLPLIVTNTTGPLYLGSGSVSGTSVPGYGIDHGGGGGGVTTGAPLLGGGSVNGGGGGAGCTSTTAGTGGSSVNGGRGGNAGINGAGGQNGTQPGGGGGGSETATGGTGGNGRIEVYVFPVAS